MAGLDSFERVPLLFGPSPGPPARAPVRAPRRRGRDLGQARGLQLRPRLRRQQGPQARVPGRRRARAGLRHARLDRRRPVQPHAAGRGSGSAPRPCVRARAGALGRLGRPRLREVGNILLSRIMGADVRLDPTRASTSGSARAGRRRSTTSGARRQAVPDPGRRLRPSARRPRLCRLGREVADQEAGARASSSTRSSCAR